MFEFGVLCVASKAMLLLSAIPLIRELRMLMPCKTSTLAHKITPTQTHFTPDGGITQISHTRNKNRIPPNGPQP